MNSSRKLSFSSLFSGSYPAQFSSGDYNPDGGDIPVATGQCVWVCYGP